MINHIYRKILNRFNNYEIDIHSLTLANFGIRFRIP